MYIPGITKLFISCMFYTDALWRKGNIKTLLDGDWAMDFSVGTQKQLSFFHMYQIGGRHLVYFFMFLFMLTGHKSSTCPLGFFKIRRNRPKFRTGSHVFCPKFFFIELYFSTLEKPQVGFIQTLQLPVSTGIDK